MHAKSLQSCLTLSNPVNCSPPGSSVHIILQARILEWVVMPSSRWSSQPRDQTHILYFLHWQVSSLHHSTLIKKSCSHPSPHSWPPLPTLPSLHPSSSLVTTALWSMWFVNLLSPHMWETIWYLTFSVGLISLRIILLGVHPCFHKIASLFMGE